MISSSIKKKLNDSPEAADSGVVVMLVLQPHDSQFLDILLVVLLDHCILSGDAHDSVLDSIL